MTGPVVEGQRRQHELSDWLALHMLDAATCRILCDAIAAPPPDDPVAHDSARSQAGALEIDVAWRTILDAMREFLPERRAIIDDTFEHCERIVVPRRGNSRKAVTLDNGPTTYPTILFSFAGEAADCMVMAHEFAHAVQIRASEGIFVAPVMREACAFLGEHALLSYAQRHNAANHADLDRSWCNDNRRYFGVLRARLETALSLPSAPYQYAWNYPVARYLAERIARRCSRDWIWDVFAGRVSVQDALRAVA